VKIENRSAASTIGNLSGSGFRAALLCGEVNSSLGLRFRETISLFKDIGYEITSVAPEDLKGNEGALAEKFVATSMFSSNTLFVLRLLTNANLFTKHLEKLLENVDLENNRNFILITSGPLEASSSLRKYAEKSEYMACIACYEETSADLSSFVRKKLKEYDLCADQNVVEYICNLGGGSTTLENEIRKLDLYKDEKNRNVSMDDVQNCLVDTSTISLDNFLESFCNFDRKKAIRAMNKIFGEGLEPIVLLRSMVRHFLLVQRICFMLSEGKNLGDIFKIERIFWKSQISLEHYVKRWVPESINFLLEQLVITEKNIKFSSLDPQLELESFVLRCLS
jgi:DNA polymerase-3 subunit delta